jgi:hypothetical protein
MARRFADARELLNDLLDRYEAGIASPFNYPDDDGLADIAAVDRFVRALEEVQATDAIRIVRGKGRNADRIAHVRLEAPERLYARLGRRPVGELADEAIRRLLDGIELPPAFEVPLDALRTRWGRGKSWEGFSNAEADRLRSAFLLAKAILEGRHKGMDYRTFSRRTVGESKALERLERAVVRLLSSALELPPGARPRDALRTLGLEKFPPPLLLSGSVDYRDAQLSAAPPAYFGIPPGEVAHVRFSVRPRYVLTIENFASFSRHIIEADPGRAGLTVYVGGYPSLATQEALRTLATMLRSEVPFFHWSDIDPDGTWIFRTIETALARDLRPHLMSESIAERYGAAPADRARPAQASGPSAIADLVRYLQRDDAKWLEQEELDPVQPETVE